MTFCDWKPIEKEVPKKWVGLPSMASIARPGPGAGGRISGHLGPISYAGRDGGGGGGRGGSSGFGCAWRTGWERSPGRERALPPVRTGARSRVGVGWDWAGNARSLTPAL